VSPLQRLNYASRDADRFRALAIEFAAELSRWQGFGVDPQRGCDLLPVPFGDAEVLIEYEYSAGRPGRYSGPPEDCYEDEPEDITVLQVLINGQFVDADLFAESVIEQWHDAIRAHMADELESDAEDMAEARARDREFA
jgi:hypothetical protein